VEEQERVKAKLQEEEDAKLMAAYQSMKNVESQNATQSTL